MRLELDMDSPVKQNGFEVLELSTDGDEAELGPLPVLLRIELAALLSGQIPDPVPELPVPYLCCC